MNTIAFVAPVFEQSRNVSIIANFVWAECGASSSALRASSPRRSARPSQQRRLNVQKMLQTPLGLGLWICYRLMVVRIRSLDQPRSTEITHWTTKAMSMLTATQHGLYLKTSTTQNILPVIAQTALILGKKQHISCFGYQHSIL